MKIEVVCRPETLAEASIAEEVASAVATVVESHGGVARQPEHRHIVGRYPHDKDAMWFDHGLEVRIVADVVKAGPSVPLVKQVSVGD